MNNTKRKRGCKSQGGCTANGASRPTGDRFKTHDGAVQWAKEYLAQYGDRFEDMLKIPDEAMDKMEFWQASTFVNSDNYQRTAEKLFKLQDELKRTKAKLNKANKEVKMLRSCLRYSDGKLIDVRLKVAELYESLGVSVGDDFDGLDELDL